MTKIQRNIPSELEGKAYLFDSARQYVLNLWNEHRDKRLVFHNYAQAAGIVQLVEEIAEASNTPAEVLEVAILAAWFHNSGFLYDYKNFAEKSAISAEFFLAERRYAPEKIHKVHQCIITAMTNLHPKPQEAQLLHDAINAYNLSETFDFRMPLLRLEQELMENKKLSDEVWNNYLFHKLFDAVYYLSYSRITYEPKTAQHFLAIKNIGEQQVAAAAAGGHIQAVLAPLPSRSLGGKKGTATEVAGELERYEKVNKGNLRSTIQTYYRSNYSNLIHLSSIADNKAHIMISVNSILLSVAISMISYRGYTDANPGLVLPIVIFMVAGLTSLIFAVLSSRPRVTSKVPEVKDKATSNFIFFGNFIHLSLEEYEEAVDKMLRDGSMLYGNMTRDTYYMGKVLDKKYRLLTFSYNIFMLGFVATVVAVLAMYFMSFNA